MELYHYNYTVSETNASRHQGAIQLEAVFFFQFSDSIVVSFDSHECGIVRNIWNKLHRAGMKQIAMGKD